MTDENINKLIQMNHDLSLLLGIATALVGQLDKKDARVKMFLKQVDRVFYQNKCINFLDSDA